jgi:hypothetical protein
MDDMINAKLDSILAAIAEIRSRLPKPALDVDIDDQYGDPVIRKDPPKWDGASMVGRRFSECPPAYLRKHAGFLDWKAGKTEQEGDPARQKYVAYDRKDAARARAWAERLEKQPTQPALMDPPF